MANFNGKYLEIKSWATFGLVLIESSNVDALIGVGNMVAQEFQVSRILVKYRKKNMKKVPDDDFNANISKLKTWATLRLVPVEKY